MHALGTIPQQQHSVNVSPPIELKAKKALEKDARWRRREATKKDISSACSALRRGSQCVW